MEKTKVFPFNNSVETGLRILSLLNASFPKVYDVEMLVYLDYLSVHSGDIDNNMPSLHPAVPYRSGEIFVRRAIIEFGIELFIRKGLIVRLYSKNGIEYQASESATPFLESLSENYINDLMLRSRWVTDKFSELDSIKLREFIYKNLNNLSTEFNLEILG